MSTRHVSLAAVRDAAKHIYKVARRTPLVRVELPPGLGPSGLELYLKLEVLQPIRSFKIRGAYNVVRQLSREQLRRRLDGQRRQRRAGRGAGGA